MSFGTSLSLAKSEKQFLLGGHRGLGSGRRKFENTVKSLKKAVDAGAHYLEFDLLPSKNSDGGIGKPVIFHDRSTKRIFPNLPERVISESTIETLKQYKSELGTFISTYEELLTSVLTSDVLLYVELKSYDFSYDQKCEFVDQVIRISHDFDVEARCMFVSFDEEVLRYIAEQYPKVTLGFNTEKKDLPWGFIEEHCDAICPYIPLLKDKTFMKRLLQTEVPILPFGSESDLEDPRILGQLSGLTTDNIPALISLLQVNNISLFKPRSKL